MWSTVTAALDSALYRDGEDGSYRGKQMGTSSDSRSSGWRDNVREFASGTLKSGVRAALRMGRDEILGALLKVRDLMGHLPTA